MKTATLPRILTIAMVLVLAACGGRATMDGADEDAPATLEVDNRANLDMTIYAVREGGVRERLGTATAHVRSRFEIPPRMLFGITSMRFQADPIGADRAPVSRTISVQPGDVVVMEIPPF